MECPKCNNKNRPGSKFCRFCGTKLTTSEIEDKDSKTESFELQKKLIDIRNFFGKRFNFKTTVIAIVVIILTATSAYAAPKVKDYFEVRSSIQKVNDLLGNYKYQEALVIITVSANKWKISSQTKELNDLKGEADQYIQDKKNFDDAGAKEKDGKFTDARDLLQKISTDFPEYNKVHDKLTEVQQKIEAGLEKQRSEAEKRAQAEAAAKTKAQADAQAAAAAKARADADAAAAARAAQQAEAERQQVAIQRAEEVKRSFRNELTAGYNSYIQGSNYYSSAVQYSNSGNSLLAISQAGSARAVLNSARSTISDLNYRFTGLPSNYYTAANNMVNAIDYLSKALDLLVNTEGTSLDYSSTINSYKNMAISYTGMVKSFLDANSY